MIRRALISASLIAMLAISADVAAQQAPTTNQNLPVPAPQSPIAPPADAAALPAGQVKVLQAAVMHVSGEAQWRQDDKAQWKAAVVNDLLNPGAHIRTGRGASMTLRVGKNATVMIASMTRLELPQIVQEGATLKTTASLHRGKADFKIDHIGLSNDFHVVTPSSTLGVRGTGFAVRWGGLEGTRLEVLDVTRIHAVEAIYFATMLHYAMEAGSSATDELPDPVIQALHDTIGYPPLFGKLADPQRLQYVLDYGALPTETLEDHQAIDEAVQGLQATLAEPLINPNGGAFLAQVICENINSFLDAYQGHLQDQFGPFSSQRIVLYSDFSANLAGFCGGLTTFQSDDFQQMLTMASQYCGLMGQFSGTDPDQCIDVFLMTVGELAEHPH